MGISLETTRHCSQRGYRKCSRGEGRWEDGSDSGSGSGSGNSRLTTPFLSNRFHRYLTRCLFPLVFGIGAFLTPAYYLLDHFNPKKIQLRKDLVLNG